MITPSSWAPVILYAAFLIAMNLLADIALVWLN